MKILLSVLTLLGIFVLAVILIAAYRLFILTKEISRLKSQGVVFNTKGIPIIDDVRARNELDKIDPFRSPICNVIKHTNNL